MDSLDNTSSFIINDSVVDLSVESLDYDTSFSVGHSGTPALNRKVIPDSDEENDSSLPNVRTSILCDKSFKDLDHDPSSGSPLDESENSFVGIRKLKKSKRILISPDSSYHSSNSVSKLSSASKVLPGSVSRSSDSSPRTLLSHTANVLNDITSESPTSESSDYTALNSRTSYSSSRSSLSHTANILNNIASEYTSLDPRISDYNNHSSITEIVRDSASPLLIEETDDESIVEISNNSSILNISSQSEELLSDSPIRKIATLKSACEMAPKIKTEEKAKQKVQTDIKSFMPTLPDSFPNSKKIYVKKEIRDNELSRLATLQEDLFKLKTLIEDLKVDKLPDGGRKLQERYYRLIQDVKQQAERVSNMVEDNEVPTVEDLKNDGFDLWNQIQKESVKVEAKYQGKQGLSTHNAQMSQTLERLRTMHEDQSTRPDEKLHIEEPKPLLVPLLRHQNQALAWLLWRENKFPHGGILADDMGLGKTLTMIALVAKCKYDSEMKGDDEDKDRWISRERKNLIRGGTLVVCPASLLSHWAGEIQRHCKKYFFKVEVHHGSKRENRPNKLAKADIVITTYNLITKDLESILRRIAWQRIILDEAHVVRNSKSLTAKSVCGLFAKYRWCLTGTPVHNKNLDLYALIQFLQCSPFDDLLVWKKWIDNKSAGAQERLALITKCLMFRRTKEQLKLAGVLNDLPEKKYEEVELKLNPHEMDVYQKVLVFSRSLFAQYLHQRAERDADMHLDLSGGSQEEYYKMHKKLVALHGGKKIKSHEILVLLLRLRQICCHPGLIAAMLDPEDVELSAIEESPDEPYLDLLQKLETMKVKEEDNEHEEEPSGRDEGSTTTEAMRSVLSSSNPVFDLKKPSTKMEAVLKCLYEKVFPNNGDKAILVSQWTSILNLFETHLKSEGIKCASITGNVPVQQRAGVVDKFNDPKSEVQVLLLSLCAGGVGLNLIGGNHLLLVDLHWNPQLEVQAQDRIYRVGQKKNVFVYRFRCMETIEEKIKQLQDSKLQLAESVLTGAKHVPSTKLTLDDMKILFDMK